MLPVIFAALLPLIASAQQDPLFTQYAYNKLAINPAYAGSAGRFSMDLISRFQWTGIKGAPRTFSFNAHTPLVNPHIGLGFYAYSDELGPSVDYGLMGAFAYRIPFRTTTLCFGLQGGLKYMDIDWSMLDAEDQDDLLITGQVKNRAVPDFDFGIYYYGSRFYTGLSAKHLFQNQVVVSSAAPDDKTSFTKLRRNYYLIAGGAVPLTENLEFIPSLLVKYIRDAPLQADLNASFLIANLLTLGVSYRTEEAMGLITVINIGKGFSVGYSYDIWFNALKSYNSGSHEIRLGYEFDLFNKERMLTPRFF
ncbi:MAG: type IX secretion system membrane protein PorP/SprF [Bacteroidetes bacterium]|nr:type IX secretion system membrane protein PorP/SprF [Bacteroidota bacterium]